MSNHHHEEGSRNFLMPVFSAFAIVFCFLVLMARCKGPYKDHDAHTEHAEHTSAPAKSHEPVEHKAATIDTSHTKPVADTVHKTGEHPAEQEHH